MRVPSTWVASEALGPKESTWVEVQIAKTGSRPRFNAWDAEKCQEEETQKEQPGV